MLVVERVVTEVRERRIDVTQPRKTCIQAVFDDEAVFMDAVRALTTRVRDYEVRLPRPTRPAFRDLCNDIQVLRETLIKRATYWTPPTPDKPLNRRQRNMQRMTRHQRQEGDQQ